MPEYTPTVFTDVPPTRVNAGELNKLGGGIQAIGQVVPPASHTMMRGYGHSIAGAGGSTLPYAEHGYMDRLAGRLGVVIEDRSKGGAIAVSNEWSPASTPYNGGWGRVFFDLPRNTRTHAPYQPDDDLVHVNLGLNDVPVLGPSVAQMEPFRRALRAIYSRIRASAVFEDNHSSCAFTGTWARFTGYSGFASGGDWRQTSTIGDKVTITVPKEDGTNNKPSRHANATVVLGFLTSPDGNGGLWDISVDGVHHGTLDTRNMNAVQRGMARVAGGGMGTGPGGGPASFAAMSVYRIKNLNNQQHTIVATATDMQGAALFDFWAIEAQIPPRILASHQQYPTELGYQIWQGNSYAHNLTTLTAPIAVGDTTATVATITQFAGYTSMQVGDTFTVEQGTAKQETFSIGAIAGNVITLAGGATFQKTHANGASVIGGWQDHDVDTLNQVIADVVAEFDDEIRIFDVNAAVGHRQDLMSDDNIHPNDQGHMEIERQAISVLDGWTQTADQKLARSRGYLHGELERRVRTRPKESQGVGVEAGYENTIQPQSAGVVPITMQGAPAQIANITEWRNSAGTLTAYVDQNGQPHALSGLALNDNVQSNALLLGFFSSPVIYFGGDAKRFIWRDPTSTLNPIRVQTSDPAATAMAIRGAAAQSVNIWQSERNDGTIGNAIDSTGQLHVYAGLSMNDSVAANALLLGFFNTPSIYFGGDQKRYLYRDPAATNNPIRAHNTDATAVTFAVRGAASQSAQVFQVENNAGTAGFTIDASGNMYAAKGSAAQLFIGNIGGLPALQFGNTTGTQTNLYQDSAGSLTQAAATGTNTVRHIIKAGPTQGTTALQEWRPNANNNSVAIRNDLSLDLALAAGNFNNAPIPANGAVGDKITLFGDGVAGHQYGIGVQASAVKLFAGSGGFVVVGPAAASGQASSGANAIMLGVNGNAVATAQTATVVPVQARAAAAQTADIFQAQDSVPTTHFAVTAAGLPKWSAAGDVQTTVGAAGAAAALPATPTKYLKVVDNSGTTLVIPAYAAV